MQIILASASPRRKQLLSDVCKEFDIIPSHFDESSVGALPPEEYVCALAEGKCEDVFLTHGQSLVIGCDTVVVFGGKILGKPKDEADAVATLKALSGKTHIVITGVCVRSPYKKLVRAETTEVTFCSLSNEFISSYVAGGSPMDKAGSYGIQDEGVVRSYIGSYTNVMGLPVSLVKELVEKASSV